MRWLVGLLLLAASILKAYQLVFDPSVIVSSTADRAILMLQVDLEYGLALLVLSGVYWQRLRWLVLAQFVGFAGYSLYLAISGATSCGCFGPVKVSPWWTFLLDCTIVLGILLFDKDPSFRRKQDPGFVASFPSRACPRRPLLRSGARGGREPIPVGVPPLGGLPVGFQSLSWSSESDVILEDRLKPGLQRGKRRLALVGSIFAATAIGFVLMFLFNQSHASNELIAETGNLVILEPETWIGHELPIAPYIDVDLSHGRWTVLLHRHDCAECQQVLPTYEELALEEQVALVEVPPFGDAVRGSAGMATHGRLSSDREWFVQTPCELILENGKVVSASHHPRDD